MKRIKYIAISGLSIAALVLGMSACSNLDDMVSGDGEFTFTASQSAVSVASRADASTSTFATGTKYYLYALDKSTLDWAKNYLWASPNGAYNLGTENGASIDLTIPSNNKFGDGQVLNFYGVTESFTSENTSLIASNSSSAPTVTVSYANPATTGGLRDVMYTKVENQSFKVAGVINLPFEHTLSLLNLFAEKQNVSNTIKITGISVCDYASGILDLSTGDYSATGTDNVRSQSSPVWRSVYSNTSGFEVTATSSAIKKDGTAVTPTIFPTRASGNSNISNHSLGIKVTFTNAGTSHTYTYWVKQLNASTAVYEPYQFKKNYSYDVNLTITDKDLVVTVLPRYFGWVNKVNESQNNEVISEIGNPVNFGGVMWADRNLGATSADPTRSAMDWERARGWYYQFGRSIPYYIKGSMQDPDHLDDASLSTANVPQVSQDSWSLNDNSSKPYPYITGVPATDDNGPIALHSNGSSSGGAYNYTTYNSGYTYLGSSSNYTADKFAIIPSGNNTGKKYNFVVDLYKTSYYPNCSFDWDMDHNTSGYTWQDAQGNNLQVNQPCPKGWRLPTKEECLTIFPCDPICGDITFNPSASSNGTNIPDYGILRGQHDWTGSLTSPSGSISYPEGTGYNQSSYSCEGVYADWKAYNDIERDGTYVGVKSASTYSGIIYCIKHQGTSKAYRIRWQIETAPSSFSGDIVANRQVLVISRYPASSTDKIVDKVAGTPYDAVNNKYYYQEFDWDHPAEQLKLPISGMVYGRNLSTDTNGIKLLYPGIWGLYWTADAYNSGNYTAYSMRMKIDSSTYDTGQRAIFTFGYDHRGFGGNIRCVRDDSAVDK